MANDSYYVILEVDDQATTEEIRRSYRKLSLKHHPDKNPNDVEGATERFKSITIAYDTLIDEEKRKAYDELLASQKSLGSSLVESVQAAFSCMPPFSRFFSVAKQEEKPHYAENRYRT